MLSARPTTHLSSGTHGQIFEVLNGHKPVGAMAMCSPDHGTITLGHDVYRIAPPADAGERAACTAAIEVAGGMPDASAATRFLLMDTFERLLAVGEKRRKIVDLHWGENSLRFKKSSMTIWAPRWQLVPQEGGDALGWVGQRALIGSTIELESAKDMSEPVQAFTLWLAARLAHESGNANTLN